MDAKVNLEAIINCKNQIQKAKQEIQKSIIYLKNQNEQIESCFLDEKYVQLTRIVNIVIDDLSHLDARIQQSTEYLAKIEELIKKYESVNIISAQIPSGASTDGIVSNPVQESTIPVMACCGVKIESGGENVSNQYLNCVKNRYEKADSLAKSVFNKFINKLCIKDINYQGKGYAEGMEKSGYGSHYQPIQSYRGIYMNSQEDLNDIRGSGNVFFHELGHMIDHLAGNNQSWFSCNLRFTRALRNDANHYRELYYLGDRNNRNRMDQELYEPRNYAVSDLLGGLTEGRMEGTYAHRDNYWEEDGSIEREAFAHFFEASMSENQESRLEPLRRYFPESYEVFREMLTQINQN